MKRTDGQVRSVRPGGRSLGASGRCTRKGLAPRSPNPSRSSTPGHRTPFPAFPASETRFVTCVSLGGSIGGRLGERTACRGVQPPPLLSQGWGQEPGSGVGSTWVSPGFAPRPRPQNPTCLPALRLQGAEASRPGSWHLLGPSYGGPTSLAHLLPRTQDPTDSP